MHSLPNKQLQCQLLQSFWILALHYPLSLRMNKAAALAVLAVSAVAAAAAAGH